jgi:hypothetical protein
MREIRYQYSDPIDLIWLETAKRLGITVLRSDSVFAAWDGSHQLTLSTQDHFDSDDCLAQLILHELCHAIVEGPSGNTKVDWGLCNIDERDLVREHACHRLQAHLTMPFGLRDFFGVTTEWRPYYDGLPQDPLEGDQDPATVIARRAATDFKNHPWRAQILHALEATAAIAALTQDFTDTRSLWSTYKDER